MDDNKQETSQESTTPGAELEKQLVEPANDAQEASPSSSALVPELANKSAKKPEPITVPVPETQPRFLANQDRDAPPWTPARPLEEAQYPDEAGVQLPPRPQTPLGDEQNVGEADRQHRRARAVTFSEPQTPARPVEQAGWHFWPEDYQRAAQSNQQVHEKQPSTASFEPLQNIMTAPCWADDLAPSSPGATSTTMTDMLPPFETHFDTQHISSFGDLPQFEADYGHTLSAPFGDIFQPDVAARLQDVEQALFHLQIMVQRLRADIQQQRAHSTSEEQAPRSPTQAQPEQARIDALIDRANKRRREDVKALESRVRRLERRTGSSTRPSGSPRATPLPGRDDSSFPASAGGRLLDAHNEHLLNHQGSQ